MSDSAAEPEDWAALDRLLSQAIELDDSEREAWLRQLAASRPAAAARVRRLLALADGDDVLDVLMSAPMLEDALAQFRSNDAGLQLGDWVVQRPLGLGGMAEVFLARRALEQGEQFAALKLISAGVAHPEQLGRFLREAAILSQLNDARIARLIDTGRAADGRPWLAMEYVDGDPIDIGCDRRQLSIAARVHLLIDVAMAVDHAHRHLVVHRDIKPGNVLLCASGRDIRLLDFGIAKMLAQTGESVAEQDQASATRAFTLHFASPEQLSGAAVSTASDIYQLGVLMYLLLTGVRPFRAIEQNPAALLAAMQEGALPPSAMVKNRADFHTRRCGLPAPRLGAQLRGDLDTIVAKAMAYEPERRYLSARDFADDLIRWHRGEAISARPDAWYRWARRLRRHWAVAAAAAVCLLLIVTYALTMTWQRQALQLERDAARKALARAEATRQFLVRVIGTANPVADATGPRDIRAALIQASGAVESEFRGQPDVAAETYTELGLVFQGMEDAVNAERAFRRALELAPTGAAPNARAVSSLAIALTDLGRAAEGRAVLAQQEAAILAHYGERADEMVTLLVARARVEQALVAAAPDRSAHEAAIMATLQRALALHNALHAPGDPGNSRDAEGMRSDLEGSVGATYQRAGKSAEALPYLRRHYEQQQRMHGAQAARTLSAQMNLATTLQKLEQYTESGLLLDGLVAALRREYGDTPNKMVAFALGAQGNQSRLTRDFDAALRYWQQAEKEAHGALGASHPWLATARYRQAEALALGGHHREAIALLEALVQIQGRSDDLVARAQALLQSTRASVTP
ncbi:MAG: serine/threonine protein kinase [Rhodanobacteraceae bacterium]|nr:serine/threonine protein kinase [Rhodanobacteraceae bacterium]